MAIGGLNPMFSSINGRIGSIVFYRKQGKDCIRAHIMPRNPDAKAQRTVRRIFADAVKSRQSMSQEEKTNSTGGCAVCK